jgi:hypothetical protein
VSRFWPRVVAMVSLAAYLLANTNASLAMQFAPRPAKHADQVQTTPNEETPTNSKKCKHCFQCKEVVETPTEEHDRSSPSGCKKGDCDEPSCPCCPGDSNQKNCPCPGGCALCSVSKIPLLAPVNFDFHHVLCLGNCPGIDSIQYISPKCDGLDRPPRI